MRKTYILADRFAWIGVIAGVGLSAAISFLLVPFRLELPQASIALIFVIPLVTAIAVGGLIAGSVTTIVGFLSYDVFFIPPFGSFAVGNPENWIPLGVYGLVGVITSLIDFRYRTQRLKAVQNSLLLERLNALPAHLVSGNTNQNICDLATAKIAELLHLEGAMILLATKEKIEICSICGDESFGRSLWSRVLTSSSTGTVGPSVLDGHEIRVFRLSTINDNLGLLVVWNSIFSAATLEALGVVVSQISSTLERAELGATRNKLDTLEQIDVWRSSLLRTVSHDLLTPLASVKTALTTLDEMSGTLQLSEKKELVETSLAQTDRSIRLVSDLLDVTRIEAGAFCLQPSPTDLVALIYEVAKSIDFSPTKTAFSFDPPLSSFVIYIDHGLVREALWNLIDNAVRHSPIGDLVTLKMEIASSKVYLKVMDAGKLNVDTGESKIFDWFHTVGNGGRSGLGLAIARSFIEAHGGVLSVACTNSGTVFSIELPMLE